jgi:lipoyl-dependent peroxiredoxin
MSKRTADAVWRGGLKGGDGTFRIPRGDMEGPYTFASRFEEGAGLSPEDLIASAIAACFSMAFSADLEKAGFVPTSVATTATVNLEPVNGAPTINRIHLDTVGVVPGIDEAAFQAAAEGASRNCPVSRLLKAAEITVSARLQG